MPFFKTSGKLRRIPGGQRLEAAALRLRESAGIDDVAVNTRAGSITVHYDPAQRTQAEFHTRP